MFWRTSVILYIEDVDLNIRLRTVMSMRRSHPLHWGCGFKLAGKEWSQRIIPGHPLHWGCGFKYQKDRKGHIILRHPLHWGCGFKYRRGNSGSNVITVILYIEDVDLNVKGTFSGNWQQVILYIEDVDLNIRFVPMTVSWIRHPLHWGCGFKFIIPHLVRQVLLSSSTLRMWI